MSSQQKKKEALNNLFHVLLWFASFASTQLVVGPLVGMTSHKAFTSKVCLSSVDN